MTYNPAGGGSLPINAERNLRARAGLVEMLGSGRTFAATGAGVSVWAGYPTWPQLITHLANAVRDDRGEEVDVDMIVRNYQNPLQCVQVLGREFRTTQMFAHFIRREFGPPQNDPHEVLYRFSGLPFRHIVTFNFEESLERAYSAMGTECGSISSVTRADVAQFIWEMDTPGYNKKVVHLHGRASDPPERIALTEDGCATLYDDPFFCNFLWLLFSSRRLLFAGFSFSDFDFIAKIREAARHVRDNGLCHYAIVGIRPEENDQALRNQMNGSFLIEPVFYPIDQNGNYGGHEAFVELINGLAQELGGFIEMQPQQQPEALTGGTALGADELRQAERLADRFVDRVDPGGGDVQG